LPCEVLYTFEVFYERRKRRREKGRERGREGRKEGKNPDKAFLPTSLNTS
jgi:hypothetical protein